MMVDSHPLEEQARMSGGGGSRAGVCVLNTKSRPIIEDYIISSNVLGLGINGKVVECFSKRNQHKYALKVR